MYRFVNIVKNSNLTDDDIWKNINYTRYEPDDASQACMSSNVEKLSHFLGNKNISYEVNENFLKNAENSLDQMYFAVIECPAEFVRLYKRAIYGPQSRMIMLALNIVKKSRNNFKLKAKNIFEKINSTIFETYYNQSVKNREDILTLQGEINEVQNIFISKGIIDRKVMETVNNHPVHMLTTNGEFSSSSFIPFCSFGDKLIGSKVKEFSMPVCNVFKPRLHYDQLCYETDLQELKSTNKRDLRNQLELGLTLVLDYNEERQINYLISKNKNISKMEFSYNLNNMILNGNSVSMYLDTISKALKINNTK